MFIVNEDTVKSVYVAALYCPMYLILYVVLILIISFLLYSVINDKNKDDQSIMLRKQNGRLSIISGFWSTGTRTEPGKYIVPSQHFVSLAHGWTTKFAPLL